jgi:hypothetical protein
MREPVVEDENGIWCMRAHEVKVQEPQALLQDSNQTVFLRFRVGIMGLEAHDVMVREPQALLQDSIQVKTIHSRKSAPLGRGAADPRPQTSYPRPQTLN